MDIVVTEMLNMKNMKIPMFPLSMNERTTTIHSKRFHNISTISNISIICPVYSIDKPTVMILASQPACLPVIVIPASV